MKLSSSVRLTSAGGFRHGTFRDTGLLSQKVWELLPDLKWLVVRDTTERMRCFEVRLDGDQPVGILQPGVAPSHSSSTRKWMEDILEQIGAYGTRQGSSSATRR